MKNFLLRVIGFRQVEVITAFEPTHVSFNKDGSFGIGARVRSSRKEWRFQPWWIR
jgi:hypothetical protein